MLNVRATITLVACAAVSSTALAGTSFNTTTNDLGMGAYQLVDQFDLLFAGDLLFFDSNLDNVPDYSVPLGQPDFVGTYVDPEHYTLVMGTDHKPWSWDQNLARQPLLIGACPILTILEQPSCTAQSCLDL